MDEAEENNLGDNALESRWARWYECSLCEQKYHGVVACALGWACWKTYLGRETGAIRGFAMGQLGNGLHDAKQHAVALPVREVELAMKRRAGASEASMLVVQANLATTYHEIGRFEESRRLRQDVYSVRLKLLGVSHEDTLSAAYNYALSLLTLERFEEAKSLLRKMMPVARRFLGEGYGLTLKLRCTYAGALCNEPNATLDDLREAVSTLEDAGHIARRVLGGAHPLTVDIEVALRDARARLRARETGDMSSLREALAAMSPPGSA